MKRELIAKNGTAIIEGIVHADDSTVLLHIVVTPDKGLGDHQLLLLTSQFLEGYIKVRILDGKLTVADICDALYIRGTDRIGLDYIIQGYLTKEINLLSLFGKKVKQGSNPCTHCWL